MANGGGNKDREYVVLREDRRKHLRKQLLVLKVKATDGRGSFFGYAKTVSRGGMFIATVNPREVGEEFDIRFEIPGTGTDATCRCKVAWRREYDPNDISSQPGMGLKFVGLTDEIRNRIDEWVKTEEG